MNSNRTLRKDSIRLQRYRNIFEPSHVNVNFYNLNIFYEFIKWLIETKIFLLSTEWNLLAQAVSNNESMYLSKTLSLRMLANVF